VWYVYFKLFIINQLQKLFQLSLVVAHVALSFNHIIFVLSALGGKLRHVCTAHFLYFHEFFTTFFVLHTRGQRGFVHGDGLAGIEYLHIQLCDLLNQLVGHGCRIECGLFLRQPVQFHGVGVSATVPYRPTTAHTVGSVVIHLVN
jgi:hypothetical protein